MHRPEQWCDLPQVVRGMGRRGARRRSGDAEHAGVRQGRLCEQRAAQALHGGAPGGVSFTDHFRTDGYQVGGGIEHTVTEGRMPAYVNVQYVYLAI